MTPVAERAPAAVPGYATVLTPICAAHLVSHYYILMLAPLFPVIRADFGVSYTQLGLALVAFNLTSALLTPPAGYLVDRTGARPVLMGGLLIGAAALAGAAVLPSFWSFVAMFALLGLGNTVYHAADYALLARHIEPRRMGQAYALHTFAGMVGSAMAPPCLLLMNWAFGWREAWLASAGLGLAAALMLVLYWGALAETPARKADPPREAPPAKTAAGSRLLLSAPIVLNLAVFTLLALMTSGMQNFSVAALGQLHGTPLSVTNVALSVYLIASALGVLAGGYVAMRMSRHDHAANACLLVFAACVLPVGLFDLNAALLIALYGVAGISNGIIMPSRDMLVRAVTPPGAFGRVFAFVTNGFNIGGIVTPLVFGWMLDRGSPLGAFLAIAAFGLVTIPLVALNSPRRATA